ncbi:putative MFS family arabinose efflux permease [Paraperlucidibaca baekdonensis]|uniref:Putative MFS family arabinose efflux permease n=1 Tax=Paraperlucidibaca baekdonensis TaxID=748120 RepID=A0A3E0H5I7_9GAMM|nr:MFS transporter [Paraperlucidibaca baekdonensis]REH38665.1 putative MFS family arabinose efflux permease [Paraperlucidibaca baekdonensis]
MSAMTSGERHAVFSLATIFSLRMVGLFMILPVFSVYGASLQGATPLLIGVAVGSYGLAQLLLQIPFGLWADRFDRKKLIIIGLTLFVLGGATAASSTSIGGVIVGRFLQGAGAISAVVMALLSDVVRDEHRTRAMAVVGISIGISFAIAFVLGPWVADIFGLSGLFWVTSVMGCLAIVLCFWRVPRARQAQRQLPPHYLTHLRDMLAVPELRRLNIGIFTLHLVMTACFVSLPPLLVAAGLPVSQHGWLYLPVMLVAFVALVPAVIIAEKKRRMREVYLSAVVVLFVAMLALAFAHQGLVALIASVALFFFAFNLLEALLPSLVSKISPAGGKGTAMGIYSTSQFLGAFLGGVVGGALHDWQQGAGLFVVLALATLVWLWRAYAMAQPAYLHSVILQPEGATRGTVGDASVAVEQSLSEPVLNEIRALAGVEELVVLPDDALIYLKVDKQHWRPESLATWPVRIIAA